MTIIFSQVSINLLSRLSQNNCPKSIIISIEQQIIEPKADQPYAANKITRKLLESFFQCNSTTQT